MNRKKKILILYADAGFGHRSAAYAIKAGLEEKYSKLCHVDIVNPLQDERAPFYMRDSQSDYDNIIKSVPELYRIGYDVSDATVPTLFVETALTLMLYDVMRDIVETYQPDIVVTTYPVYPGTFGCSIHNESNQPAHGDSGYRPGQCASGLVQ